MSFFNATKALHWFASPDGVHWNSLGTRRLPTIERRFSTIRFAAAGASACATTLADTINGRYRRYWESPAFAPAPDWPMGRRRWRRRKRIHVTVPARRTFSRSLYNLDCVAYESLMLGLFTIWRGEPLEREKINEIVLGFSRDGFHWHRPDRAAFIPRIQNSGDWNWANVQSAGGCCLVVGDQLYFYVSGRQGDPGNRPGVCTTGLAVLRRDGFASITDDGPSPQPMRLRAYRRQADDAAADVFRRPLVRQRRRAAANCASKSSMPTAAPSTRRNQHRLPVTARVSPSSGKSARASPISPARPYRFRFRLDRARLYAFWVSANAAGRSGGYVGACAWARVEERPVDL